jgi:hypothetical protein
VIRSNNQYPIQQSPLYRLRGINQFEKVLQVKWTACSKLLAVENYRVWHNDKGREIQQPVGWLAHVHTRIGKLLSRISVPDYVYSRKKRSYADNAVQHLGVIPLIKTDIHKFYPSTTKKMVYEMFVRDFECAKDIANKLADICCFRQEHLPTGSPISGRLAFFAAQHMFNSIDDLAAKSECVMTLYVDDVTLSGTNASKTLLSEVRRLIRRQGLRTKREKSKTFAAHAAKTITGAVVVGDEIRLPNKRYQKIWQTRKALASSLPNEKKRLHKVLRGRLQQASQLLTAQTNQTKNKESLK